mgnify:FL=1
MPILDHGGFFSYSPQPEPDWLAVVCEACKRGRHQDCEVEDTVRFTYCPCRHDEETEEP